MATLTIDKLTRLSAALPISFSLAEAVRTVAAGARACLKRFVAGLREARRQQAALTIARHQHLMSGTDSATQSETAKKDGKRVFMSPSETNVEDI